MTYEPSIGDWVLTTDGTVAQVVSVDASDYGPVVVAQGVDGSEHDRPAAFVRTRWRLLSGDGLLVRAALDRARLEAALADAPADVIVAALIDSDGEATTDELKRAIVPTLVPADGWQRWWRPAQLALRADPRVDPSRSLERRYRLLRDGEARREPPERALLSEETLGGLQRIDGRVLKELRKAAAASAPASRMDPRVLELVRIGGLDGVDPTDRFAALDAGVTVGVLSEEEAWPMLGRAVLDVDLLRLPSHASRDRAISWAGRPLTIAEGEVAPSGAPSEAAGPVVDPPSVPIILRSATARGGPWRAAARDLLVRAGGDPVWLARWVLGWAFPGDPDTEATRTAQDLRVFRGRLARAEAGLASLRHAERQYFVVGAIDALDGLAAVGASVAGSSEVIERTAAIAWSAAPSLSPGSITERRFRTTTPAALAALAAAAPEASLVPLRRLVVDRYLHDPVAFRTVLLELSEAVGTDPGALALDGARERARAEGIFQLAADAAQMGRNPAVRAAGAALAGTLVSDGDPAAQRLAETTTRELGGWILDGTGLITPPVLLNAAAVRQLAATVRGAVTVLREALAETRTARDRAAERVLELERVESLLQQELQSTRTTSASADRSDTRLVASRLLRPVAEAVADSFESRQIEPLQDRLLAVLERGGLRVTIDAGEVQPFDPRRHRWVGDEEVTQMVRALSPGFEITLGSEEGAEDVVVVPARVVAP